MKPFFESTEVYTIFLNISLFYRYRYIFNDIRN